MIIDKTNKITKIVGIILCVVTIYDLFLLVRGFTLYRFIITIANGLLAFVCFKTTGKDKEICVGIFGVLTIFEIIRVFLEDSFTLEIAGILLLRILGYLAIAVYCLGVTNKKIVPIIGGTMVLIFGIRNIFVYITNINSLQGIIKISRTIMINCIINVLGEITYFTFAIAMVVLIIVGAIKQTKYS